MKFSRRFSSFIHALAIAALLMHGQLMSVAKASMVSDGSMPVCTTGGVKWLQSSGDPVQPSKLATPHCAWCSSGTWAVVLPDPQMPPAPPAEAVATIRRDGEAPLPAQAAHTRPPSRAPPALN